MTRGTLIAFTDKGIIMSCEFNGDMAPNADTGARTLERLTRCKTEADFKQIVADLVSEYNYEDKEIVFVIDRDQKYVLDVHSDYFERFFSDYVYVVNLTKHNCIIVSDDGRVLTTAEPFDVACYNFGRLCQLTRKEEE